MKHTLNDIIVWKTNDGRITITSCLENLKIAVIGCNRVDWFAKDVCSPEVITWAEENVVR